MRIAREDELDRRRVVESSGSNEGQVHAQPVKYCCSKGAIRTSAQSQRQLQLQWLVREILQVAGGHICKPILQVLNRRSKTTNIFEPISKSVPLLRAKAAASSSEPALTGAPLRFSIAPQSLVTTAEGRSQSLLHTPTHTGDLHQH
jgi:hypothetical protein